MQRCLFHIYAFGLFSSSAWLVAASRTSSSEAYDEKVSFDEGASLSTASVVNSRVTGAAAEPTMAGAWMVMQICSDSYKAYKSLGQQYNEYVKRNQMIKEISTGFTGNTASIVEAATSAFHRVENAGKLQQVIAGDLFREFLAVLRIFEQAQSMCILRTDISKDIVGGLAHELQSLSPQELEEFRNAQSIIADIVHALHGVIDYQFCPQLAAAIKEDLGKAQMHVEQWERLNQESWYQMLYDSYASGGLESKVTANVLTMVKTALQDIRSFGSVRTPHDKCFSSASRRSNTDLDQFDVEFTTREALNARSLDKKISAAMDRASLNLEMYEKECQRVEPKGRDGLQRAIDEAARAGDVGASREYRALTCDLCMLIGCRREAGIWATWKATFEVVNLAVGAITLKAAKKFLPSWYTKIDDLISNAKDVLMPDQERIIKFFVSAFFLIKEGQDNLEPAQTCRGLGKYLNVHTYPAAKQMLMEIAGTKVVLSNMHRNAQPADPDV